MYDRIFFLEKFGPGFCFRKIALSNGRSPCALNGYLRISEHHRLRSEFANDQIDKIVFAGLICHNVGFVLVWLLFVLGPIAVAFRLICGFKRIC